MENCATHTSRPRVQVLVVVHGQLHHHGHGHCRYCHKHLHRLTTALMQEYVRTSIQAWISVADVLLLCVGTVCTFSSSRSTGLAALSLVRDTCRWSSSKKLLRNCTSDDRSLHCALLTCGQTVCCYLCAEGWKASTCVPRQIVQCRS